jgi:hypothetical protein
MSTDPNSPPPVPPNDGEENGAIDRFLTRIQRIPRALSTGEKPSEGQRFQIKRSHIIRVSIALALIALSIVTNRGYLAWGLLFILGVLFVPMGRARAFLLAFVPYAGIWFIFTALRSLADETILARTLNLDVSDFERWLFGGRIPTVRLQDRFYEPGHLQWYDYLLTGIHWSYFVVPHLIAVIVWYKRPDLFKRFLAAMGLMLGVGLGIYFLIPTNPPWLSPEPINSPSAAVVYRIMNSVGEQLGGGLYQASYRVVGESNPRAAMPSIHLAFTALLIFPVMEMSRRWGNLILAYTASMGLALMYLGEHYFIDLVVGAACAAYGWYAAGAWLSIAAPLVWRRGALAKQRSRAPSASPG